MFHSCCSGKHTPHGMDLRKLQRMCTQTLPSLIVKAEIMKESLKALGGKPTTNQKNNKLTVYADSCCPTCTAGPDLIAALGCPETVLAPTSHSINGITESKVQILGTLPLKISLKSEGYLRKPVSNNISSRIIYGVIK